MTAPTPPPRRPGLARTLAWAFAGFVVLFVLAEWAVGTWIMSPSTADYDPDFGLVHRPGSRFVNSREGWSSNRANSMGRFDDEPRVPRPPHVVLLLGDSYAEALQVSRAQGFAQVAERAVPGLEVINVAQSGRAPAHHARFAPIYVRRLQPDLVIVQLNDADVPELLDPKPGDAIEAAMFAGDSGAVERAARMRASPMQRLRRLPGRSALLRYARVRVLMLQARERERLGRKFGLVAAAAGADTLMDAIPAGADSAADAAFRSLRASCPQLVALYIPAMDYFAHPPRPERPNRGAFWRAAAARNGIELIDPTDAILAEYARTGEPLHGFNNSTMGVGHINALGHRLVGEMLAASLRRRFDGG